MPPPSLSPTLSTCHLSALQVRVSAWDDRPVSTAMLRDLAERTEHTVLPNNNSVLSRVLPPENNNNAPSTILPPHLAAPRAAEADGRAMLLQPSISSATDEAAAAARGFGRFVVTPPDTESLTAASSTTATDSPECGVNSAATPPPPPPPPRTRAMLWLPGRNDCFFHAHVANLLDEMGIDLYVLNYRRVGECRCALACCLHPEPPSRAVLGAAHRRTRGLHGTGGF